jgi:hypothetical protein
MSLESNYNASNNNIKPIRYSVASKHLTDNSILNVDVTPTKYPKEGGRLSTWKSNDSQLDLNSTPTTYNPR